MAKTITAEEVISRFKKVHGNRYDYSKVKYTDAKTKVEVLCKNHGVFLVTPSKHYGRGHGCPQCAGRTGEKITANTFRARATKVHNGCYDYSMVKNPTSRGFVEILCKKHGAFSQRVDQHLAGKGCPLCCSKGKPIQEKLEEFIGNSTEAHNNKYDYSKVIFINKDTKVVIVCPIHGEFEQTPYSHLNLGRGCQICARRNTGFRPEGKALLYYLRIETEAGPLYKIGITGKSIVERYSPSELSMITVLFTVKYDVGRCARDEEQRILKEYELFLYTGKKVLFSGNTELFVKDILNKDTTGEAA